MPKSYNPEQPRRRDLVIHKPGQKPLDSLNSKRWGPCMAALTELQRMFVLEMCEQPAGDMNYARAYRNAGYQDSSPNATYVNAHRLAHDQRVLDAIHEVVAARMRAALPMAARAMQNLAKAPGQDQFKAVKDILDRGGLMPAQKVEKRVMHEMLLTSEPALLESIASLCKSLDMDVDKVLGKRIGKQVTIEAEYEDVPEVADLDEIEGDVSGLEDLL